LIISRYIEKIIKKMVRKEKENKSQMTVKRKIQKKLTRNEKMAKCKII
jgi:hypothetical protein